MSISTSTYLYIYIERNLYLYLSLEIVVSFFVERDTYISSCNLSIWLYLYLYIDSYIPPVLPLPAVTVPVCPLALAGPGCSLAALADPGCSWPDRLHSSEGLCPSPAREYFAMSNWQPGAEWWWLLLLLGTLGCYCHLWAALAPPCHPLLQDSSKSWK